MEKRVELDPSKVEYDGKSFKVVISEEELKKKFHELRRKISEDHGDEAINSDDVEPAAQETKGPNG